MFCFLWGLHDGENSYKNEENTSEIWVTELEPTHYNRQIPRFCFLVSSKVPSIGAKTPEASGQEHRSGVRYTQVQILAWFLQVV